MWDQILAWEEQITIFFMVIFKKILLFAFMENTLKGVWHEIFDISFFHKSVSPGPLSIPLGPFQIFSKIRGDIREWMFISVVNDTGEKREKF